MKNDNVQEPTSAIEGRHGSVPAGPASSSTAPQPGLGVVNPALPGAGGAARERAEAKGIRTLHSVKVAGLSTLQLAAVRGDYSTVRSQLRHPDTPLSHLGPQDWSALHFAAREGHTRVAALLAENRRFMAASTLDCAVVIVPHLKSVTGITPLHLAAYAGYADVARALLASRYFAPFVNAVAESAKGAPISALHTAIMSGRFGHASVVKSLLESETFSEASVNSLTDHGRTALHLACNLGNEDVVQLLLDDERFTAVNARGVDHDDFDGHTALTLAIMADHKSIVCLLLRHPRFHAVDCTLVARGQPPRLSQGPDALQLMASARFDGMSEGVQLYLDMHACNKPGTALRLGALSAAVRAGHKNVVRTLMTHPAVEKAAELAYVHPNRHRSEANVLHVACYLGHKHIVEYLLSLDGCEAAVNATNGKNKMTALHIAVAGQHEDIALCLLQNKSFFAVNRIDVVGRTALHIACEEKLEDIALEILRHPQFIKHGARCSYGKTALELATERELRSVISHMAH
mmetsp:Transcript_847/g.1884  ORF Transcript_847/g.1884 Transcript_847/m.1884 type:complete len:519 (-) Transcript_847:87-1643(-)